MIVNIYNPLAKMKRKLILHLVFFLLFGMKSFSQNEEKKWFLSIGSSSVLYAKEDASAIGGRYFTQFPRLSGGLYAFKNVTLVGSLSFTLNSPQHYASVDGSVRYDFGTSKNTISPFVMIGGSFIKSTRSKYLLPTLNFGGGATIWISDKLGLTGEFMYRFNEERFQSQKSHTFASAGIVYRFSLFGDSNSSSSSTRVIKDSRRKRIWDTRN